VRFLNAPYLLLPTLIFPLLLFAAFAGGLSAVSRAPNFNYFNYTTFQLVYVLIQAAAAGGAQTGIAVAQDFESGFARRMLVSTPRRAGLIIGYVLSSLSVWVVVAGILTAVGIASGARFHGNPLQIVGLYGISALFNVVAVLWASGLALRAQSTSVGPAIQTPILLPLFLAPVFTPRNLLSGWIRHIADVNPVTAFLEAGRGLAAGRPVSVAIAYAIMAGLVVLAAMLAASGLRRAAGAHSSGRSDAAPRSRRSKPAPA
jgi:ABC-2 type transport system permease protein